MEIVKKFKVSKENNIAKEKETKDISKIIKGSIIALILTIIMITIYAGVLSFTNVSENSMTVVLTVITGFSLLIGSSVTNMKVKRNGMLNGAAIGLIYFLGIYIISSIVTGNFSLNINSFIMIAARNDNRHYWRNNWSKYEVK